MYKLIGNLHALLHADDTLVFSSNRDLFIEKCNILIDTYHKKKLLLNLKKSAYMIMYANKNGVKLKSGWLPNKQSVVYLGSLFSEISKKTSYTM